jgi:hypothetical protein
MNQFKKHLLLGLIILTFSTECSKEAEKPVLVDPLKNRDLLGKILVIDNATNQNGTPPAPTTSTSTPKITNSQNSASVTANSKIFIPFTFSGTTSIAGIYLSVDGSGNYWKINIPGGPSSGQIVLPVGIPANVTVGNFSMTYCLFTANGLVSQPVTLDAEIVDINTSCTGNVYESGSDGLTVRSYTYATGGTLSIKYNMYTAPDRMDIFLDGTWVAGTGSSISSSQAPPASNCSSPSAGFVSGTGTKLITYKAGQRMDIYLSGCFGGTAWNYTFDCP